MTASARDAVRCGGTFRLEMAVNLTMLAAVAAGGALGAVARHLVAVAMQATPGQFPWPTLAVNVVGTLVLAGVVALTLTDRGLSETTRLFLATGFCGALTTYSTFSVETI
ncbi:MAG: CrcB protein, partial [Myxococcota bacterium]